MEIKRVQSATLITLLIFFSIGFYSCDEDNDDDNSVVTPQDRNFTKNASNCNFTEIQFGQLAVQNATGDSVSDFATEMITYHTKAQNQLNSIAKDIDIELTDNMDATHQTLYGSLSQMTGPAFDSIYIHNQILDHQITLEILQDQIDNGDNDGLVNYAREQLIFVALHLQTARNILATIYLEGQNP